MTSKKTPKPAPKAPKRKAKPARAAKPTSSVAAKPRLSSSATELQRLLVMVARLAPSVLAMTNDADERFTAERAFSLAQMMLHSADRICSLADSRRPKDIDLRAQLCEDVNRTWRARLGVKAAETADVMAAAQVAESVRSQAADLRALGEHLRGERRAPEDLNGDLIAMFEGKVLLVSDHGCEAHKLATKGLARWLLCRDEASIVKKPRGEKPTPTRLRRACRSCVDRAGGDEAVERAMLELPLFVAQSDKIDREKLRTIIVAAALKKRTGWREDLVALLRNCGLDGLPKINAAQAVKDHAKYRRRDAVNASKNIG